MRQLFSGFSPESFEQFSRAIALVIFGPGVSAFGNGPDGGREATFDGAVPYPYPPTDQWMGYGVIQAKFKEKIETTEKDQKWALDLLESELKLFATKRKKSRKPQYYVFVTNVELSSAAGGGRDQADGIVAKYRAALGILGHSIWDANQLSSLVDESRCDELRRRYSAFLTTGDVLAVLLDELVRRRSDTIRILTTYLERELGDDRTARLEQAGDRADTELPLDRLFFDILTAPQPDLSIPEEKVNSDGELPPGVVEELLKAGSRKLDPDTLVEHEQATTQMPDERIADTFVILGGPGSGKSTVGQFLSQIHRALLLSRIPQAKLSQTARRTVKQILKHCDNEGLTYPAMPRYPIRVELNRFAKVLAEQKVHTFGDYLLQEVRGTSLFEYDDLLELFTKYPWILILDGLDEVPVTSNREQVIHTIRNFLTDARHCGSDLLIVTTSRPSGYDGEFSDRLTAHRYVRPLSLLRALKYIQRYADIRFETDKRRGSDLVKRIRDGATPDQL